MTTVTGCWMFPATKGITSDQCADLSVDLLLFYFSNFWVIRSNLHRLEDSAREMTALLKAGDFSLTSLETGTQINLEFKDLIARQKLTRWIHIPTYVLILLITCSLIKV